MILFMAFSVCLAVYAENSKTEFHQLRLNILATKCPVCSTTSVQPEPYQDVCSSRGPNY